MTLTPFVPLFVHPWHVVVASDSTVLAVYAGPRLAHAEQAARVFARPGVSAFVETVARARKPRVGDRLR